MTYKAVDTHCHPQFPQYDSDREAVLRRALSEGIAMVCVGTDMHTSARALELARGYKGLWASVGVHPTETELATEDYKRLLADPKAVAVGEIGLDYYHVKSEDERARQMDLFIAQLDIASELNKPVIIHCRDAHDDMIKTLSGRSVRGVIHSFNGSEQEASVYIGLGFYIGLNAIVTFSEQYKQMVRSLPSERIVLETDAPYLAPAPHRGHRNEPVYIVDTAERVAGIRGEDMADLLRASVINAEALYNIKQ